MSLAIISHPDCLLHENAPGHPEQPARIQVIQEALQHYPFSVPIQWMDAPLASKEQLLTVHKEDYVEKIFSLAPKKGSIALDPDTGMNPYTLFAALRSAGAMILAVDLVMKDQAQAVFCNIRPPGHHAESEQAMGFCFFNNVAVGTAYALNHYHLERVAIIDFDVHHGNGTQEIFQQDKRVLYCSSFEHPFYPGYNAALDNEHILSVPLPAGTSGKYFREQVSAAWFSKIEAFQPQLIFFSAGFDAHEQDPLADLSLKEEDYVWLTQQIAAIAKTYCNGKMISLLEGGYNLEALARSVPAHVNAMLL